jgi:hypothetical protein
MLKSFKVHFFLLNNLNKFVPASKNSRPKSEKSNVTNTFFAMIIIH